ncbi:MAG: hypothetical protein H0X37_26680 [Herpetosiphonaceae bacterium]|nr:hypothetical protein [Herpetosiphonaceae bacterium]
MIRSFLGSGIALDHPVNYGAFIDLHRAVNPTTVLGMVDAAKDMAKIRQLQRDLPGVQIIGRVYHPEEGGYAQKPEGPGDTRPMIATPEGVLEQQVELGHGGVWLHVMNEPSAYLDAPKVQLTVDWLVKFIRLAAPENCACVLGNLADQHPRLVNGLWEAIWNPFLIEMALHPELMKLGLHFYGPDKVGAVMTALNATCKTLRIKPPQVVGTEFGVDSTGQGDKANSYHNRGWNGETFLNYEADVIQGELKPFIVSGQLVGVDTFQWNELWGPFSIAKDQGYQDAYKKTAQNGGLDVVVVPPQPEPPPVVIIHPPPVNPPPQETMPSPEIPPMVIKHWQFGLDVVCTDAQAQALQTGLQKLFEAAGYLSLATGARIDVTRSEIPMEVVL